MSTFGYSSQTMPTQSRMEAQQYYSPAQNLQSQPKAQQNLQNYQNFQNSQNMQDYRQTDQPFQRNNNVYWTLQTKNRQQAQQSLHELQQNLGNYGAQDDFNLMQNNQKIEDLYSTPNKNRRNQLKTTPLGFDFYSPVTLKKVQETDEENDAETSSYMSPIDPTIRGSFQTSTPQRTHDNKMMSPKPSLPEEIRNRLRLNQDSGIRSHGNSPINSGRSTPKGIFEPQASRTRHSWSNNNVEIPQTCQDRMGTPKTSLMDFKKLLLNKGSTGRPGKISAVEALKASRGASPRSPCTTPPPVGVNSSMNILDLSGSPKTFATRRMIRQGQFGGSLNSSPSKSKHAWRFQNMRTEVITTAIPEVNSEEDSTPNSSNERSSWKFDNKPEMIPEEKNGDSPEKNLNTIVEEKQTPIKDNMFLREEENNFTKSEIQQQKKSNLTTLYSRAQLQQQRANFLLGNALTGSAVSNNKTASFKNGHYAGIVTTTSSSPAGNGKAGNGNMKIQIVTSISTPTTNTTSNASAMQPSLETAL